MQIRCASGNLKGSETKERKRSLSSVQDVYYWHRRFCTAHDGVFTKGRKLINRKKLGMILKKELFLHTDAHSELTTDGRESGNSFVSLAFSCTQNVNSNCLLSNSGHCGVF